MFIVSTLLAISLFFATRIALLDYRAPDRDIDEVSTVWQPQLFKILTFGHTPAAVDVQLLKFLVDRRIDHVQSGTHPKIFYYLDLATDLDPKFFSLYTAGTNFLAVARDDDQGAIKLIAKGEVFRKNELHKLPQEFRDRYWGVAWRIPFIKGYVHLFELNDLPGAAEAYGELDKLEDAPPLLRAMGERIKTKKGAYDVGMRVLQGMIQTEKDPVVKEELNKKRNSLFLSQYLYELNTSFESYWKDDPRRAKLAQQKKWPELYAKFANENRVPPTDLWGGRIHVDSEGKIQSTTPRMKVMGMD